MTHPQATAHTVEHAIELSPGLTVRIPVLVLGDGGSPRVTVFCGLHGDELDTLIAVNHLREQWQRDPPPGTMRVVLFSNPVACLEQKRVASYDGQDMNRRFGLAAEGSPAQRLAQGLLEQVDGAELAFSLHQLETRGILHVGLCGPLPPRLEKVRQRAVQAMQPDGVFVVDLTRPEWSWYERSLETAVQERGVPAILVEMTRRQGVAEQASRLGTGLHAAWKSLSSITRPSRRDFPTYERRVHVRAAGLSVWRPGAHLELNQMVPEGAVLGHLIDVAAGRVSTVTAPTRGHLVQLRLESSVRSGQYVAILGARA